MKRELVIMNSSEFGMPFIRCVLAPGASYPLMISNGISSITMPEDKVRELRDALSELLTEQELRR